MGSSRTSLPVVQDNTIPPIVGPPDGALFPVLVEAYRLTMLVASLAATMVAYLFPDPAVIAPPNPHVQQYDRGVRRNLVAVPPQATVAPAHLAEWPQDAQMIPNEYQRRLVLILAFCSSITIVVLSNLIGPADLPPVVSSVDMSLDLPGALDIVNESVGHMAQNVASASASIRLYNAGRRLAELVCEAT